MWIRATDALRLAKHVSAEDAARAVRIAADILKAVAEANPAEFRGLFDF